MICFICATCLVIANRYYDVYQIPYEVTQGGVGMFYYHTGVVFKNNYKTMTALNESKKMQWVLIPVVVLVASAFIYKHINSDLNLSALRFPIAPVDMVNAGCAVVGLFFVVEYGVRKEILSKANKFLAWFGESSMIIYLIHCVEFHFTIPLISYLVKHIPSSWGVLKYAIICGNPIAQIIICICGLYTYKWLKNMSKQKTQD